MFYYVICYPNMHSLSTDGEVNCKTMTSKQWLGKKSRSHYNSGDFTSSLCGLKKILVKTFFFIQFWLKYSYILVFQFHEFLISLERVGGRYAGHAAAHRFPAPTWRPYTGAGQHWYLNSLFWLGGYWVGWLDG